ncbi:MAG: cell division protein ZapA [Candidatus Dadabacteria bacterium]|nr:cell division protein ZapA [Candidatus Dadabacteria bacterium]
MKRVKINVLNNELSLLTDAEEEYVREISKFLEERVMETSPDTGSLVVPRPFLLATVKIVDDYFRLKREFEEFKNRAEERSRRLVEILDSSLVEKETFEHWRGGRRESQKKEV